jgi:8-amino-7-oxononanoate synthase
MEQVLAKKIEDRKNKFLFRTRSIRQAAQASTVFYKNTRYLSFCSNDYLGLSNHPEVKFHFKKAIEHYGVGSAASSVVSGYSQSHHALEEELAHFMGYEKALIFSTGCMANVGILCSLLGRFDNIFADKLNHASLLDGALFSKAKIYRYPHRDYENLQKQFETTQFNKANGKKLIVTEGVFSMDGGIVPLDKLSSIAKFNNAWLMMDDAHGIGVLGKQGRGTLEHFALTHKEVPIVVGTFGKAFGGFGAFVVGSKLLIETLIQFARPYLYTTALPAAITEAVRVSLKIIQREPERRLRLQTLVQYFKNGITNINSPGLKILPSDTPIQSVVVGEPYLVQQLGKALESKKVLVGIIRTPTVPYGTDRIRISFCTTHTPQQVDYLLESLEWAQKFILKH